jgi:hypothetical protein
LGDRGGDRRREIEDGRGKREAKKEESWKMEAMARGEEWNIGMMD